MLDLKQFIYFFPSTQQVQNTEGAEMWRDGRIDGKRGSLSLVPVPSLMYDFQKDTQKYLKPWFLGCTTGLIALTPRVTVRIK